MANSTAKHSSSTPAKPQTALSSTAANQPAKSKPTAGSKPNSLLSSSVAPVTAEMRQAMIAEAAYYIAEQRGFEDGHDVEDWLIAEKQIDGKISTSQGE